MDNRYNKVVELKDRNDIPLLLEGKKQFKPGFNGIYLL
jgi:hypothetical protein